MTSLLLLGEKGEVLSPSNETASACRCQGAVLQGHGHEHLVTTAAWEAKSPTAPALQGVVEAAWRVRGMLQCAQLGKEGQLCVTSVIAESHQCQKGEHLVLIKPAYSS